MDPMTASLEVDAFVGDFMHNPHFEELRTKLADTFSQVNRITVGSMITGWVVLEMVLHSLERLWNQAHSEDAHFEVGGANDRVSMFATQTSLGFPD